MDIAINKHVEHKNKTVRCVLCTEPQIQTDQIETAVALLDVCKECMNTLVIQFGEVYYIPYVAALKINADLVG